MLLELGRAGSLLLSILSLYSLAMSAFFVPGSRWEDRLSVALLHVALAGCICVVSGLIFAWPSQVSASGGVRTSPALLSTLPVQLYFGALVAVVLLFAGSWYLDTYYVPLLWKNQP